MGERLVLDVENDGKVVAKIYYHWSGYTTSAIDECVKLIESWKENKKEDEPIEFTLLKIIYSYGGGIANDENLEDEINYLEGLNSGLAVEVKSGHRNEGLIAFSEKGKKNHDDWAEETATVYLDRPEPTFEVFGTFMSWDEDEDYEKLKEKAIRYNIDSEFTIEEAEDLKDIAEGDEVIFCKGDYWKALG